MTEYKPGTCNINELESRKRLLIGIVGFFNAAVVSSILLLLQEFLALYPTIFLLNLTGFIGCLQYRNHFCTGFALKKKFKVADSEEPVEDSEKISRDRRKAVIIIVESVLGAGLLTGLVYLVAANI